VVLSRAARRLAQRIRTLVGAATIRVIGPRRARAETARQQRANLEALHMRQLELLQRARIEAVQAMEARRRLEGLVERLDGEAVTAAREARVAANVESDEHVRSLLRREQAARDRSAELAPVLARLREHEATLAAGVERIAGSVDAFAQRKQGLLARQTAAQASEQVALAERQLRDQSAAVDEAVQHARETAADAQARAEVGTDPSDR
jgi:phage shock protein A